MNAPTDLKWAAKFPDLGTGPIPVEPCISPEFYEEERKKVFLKSWLKVGRVEEIAKPGDYKVKKLAFAKTSVILMRGKDGQIRGFHNTCSHRGNKVIVETGEETFGRNKAAVVTCRFHGWVYDAKGDLVSVPFNVAEISLGATRSTKVDEPVWAPKVIVVVEENVVSPGWPAPGAAGPGGAMP